MKSKLLITLIITYGKCFSKTDKRIKLEFKDIFKFANGEDMSSMLKSIHTHIIDVRNYYVAHHQSKKYEKSFLLCFLNPNLNNKSIIKLVSQTVYMTDIDKYIDKVHVLINFVSRYCINNIEKLEKQIEKELNVEDLYNKAKSVNS